MRCAINYSSHTYNRLDWNCLLIFHQRSREKGDIFEENEWRKYLKRPVELYHSTSFRLYEEYYQIIHVYLLRILRRYFWKLEKNPPKIWFQIDHIDSSLKLFPCRLLWLLCSSFDEHIWLQRNMREQWSHYVYCRLCMLKPHWFRTFNNGIAWRKKYVWKPNYEFLFHQYNFSVENNNNVMTLLAIQYTTYGVCIVCME